MQISPAEFDAVVERALDLLPLRFAELMQNIAVQVQDRPDPQTIRDLGLDPGRDTLYGLYTGVPLDRRGGWYGNVLPDVIVLYRRPLTDGCRSSADLIRQIQLTLLHEIGHHFGFSDAEMDRWEEEFEGLQAE
jgi:predicted Zn-dependent protease with MMP-like domain